MHEFKEITAAGDRYGVEEMRKSDTILVVNTWPRRSRVTILPDGQLTGVHLDQNHARKTGKKLSELAAEVTIYPQN